MERTALMLVDVQKGFDNPQWGIRNNHDAERNIARLLTSWRTLQSPIIHIQHRSTTANSPLAPDQPGCDFKPEATPIAGEPIFGKQVNSAFIGTRLDQFLQEQGIHKLVIAGFTTDHCVSTTTRMAGNLGYETVLVSDATATFNRRGLDGVNISANDIHNAHLASLDGEFCMVKTTDEVLIDFI